MLTLLAPGNEALTGDLLEQFQHGKSRSWFWRQVVSTIVLGAWRELTAERVAALRAVAMGWAVMLLFLFLAGDCLTHAGDRTVPPWLDQLGSGKLAAMWLMRFRYIPPAVLGCVLSGWVVGRPVLFYAVSLFVALAGAVAALAWINAPVAVPHAFFYVIILALPYWWWSGLLIVPTLIVLGGLWRAASSNPISSKLNRKFA